VLSLGRVKRIAVGALLVLTLVSAGRAAAASSLALRAACAPDDTRFGWTIELPARADQRIELSWGTSLTVFQTIDFGTPGVHALATARGGTTLVARAASDRSISATATASTIRCAPDAVGSVQPIVELPGGSDQQSPSVPVPGSAVRGVQSAPAAIVARLPSTSTDRTPSVPLVGLGLAIIALGGAVLLKGARRRGRSPARHARRNVTHVT
jgi:hypothetical protein